MLEQSLIQQQLAQQNYPEELTNSLRNNEELPEQHQIIPQQPELPVANQWQPQKPDQFHNYPGEVFQAVPPQFYPENDPQLPDVYQHHIYKNVQFEPLKKTTNMYKEHIEKMKKQRKKQT